MLDAQKRRLMGLECCKMYQELEVLTDPMRKEVGMVRKKIDTVNRELKSLGQAYQKKVLQTLHL